MRHLFCCQHRTQRRTQWAALPLFLAILLGGLPMGRADESPPPIAPAADPSDVQERAVPRNGGSGDLSGLPKTSTQPPATGSGATQGQPSALAPVPAIGPPAPVAPVKELPIHLLITNLRDGAGNNVGVRGQVDKTIAAVNANAAQQPSALQLIRNYQNAIKSIGGEVVYERLPRDNDGGETTLRVATGGKEVWVLVEPGIFSAPTQSYRIAVVSMKKAYPGHAKRVMFGVWSYLRQFMYTKWVIVVDEGVNARDWKDVMWAVATRMDPARDITLVENTPIDYLDFASPVSGLGSKIGLDATNKWPPETKRDWGRKIRMSDDVIKRVDKLWPELDLPGSGKSIWK